LDSGIVLHLPGSVFPAPVNSIVVNRKDQIFFASGNTLCRLNPDFANFKIIGKFKDTTVRKLCLLPDGSIALLTKGKSVILYRKGRFSPLVSNYKRIDNVYSFLVESDNSFLLGTVHGLFRVTGQSFEHVRFGKKVITRPIYSILTDPLGRIWLGSDNGVFRWDGFDLRHYTAKNGFVGQETNRSAAYVDAQGQVWFGADRGVFCFREEYDFQFDKIPPPRVEISEASANEIVFSPFKNQSLSYNDNNLQFRFRAISFIDERENYFRYKLEGYDETWSEPFISKDHLIRFTNLPHGHYRFYLQARNTLGMWSDIVSSGLITINQPYWMKWWFYLILSSVIAMSVVGTTIILYQRRYSKHLEKEVERRTAELADSERQYHLTIDSLKDAIHVVDENLRIKLCNQRAIERNEKLGLDTDVIGRNIFKAFPFLSKEVKEEYEYVFRSGKMLETERIHSVNGVSFITEVRKIPIFEKDRVTSVLTVIHDATERRIAEREKQKAQALLKAAIEQTTAGIIIMDAPEFRIKLVNTAACEILDIKDLQNVDWQKVLGAEKWQVISEETEEEELVGLDLIQVAKNGKSLENQITILQSGDGKSRWMYVNVAPVRDEQRKIIASVIVFQDITDIKQAEKQIRDSLKEKNVLLKEIHHRVKNNLQVVSSLLFLQSKKVSDKQAKRMFQNSRDRIKSIALVHEKMYRSANFAQVNFADYVRSLSHSLYQVYHVDPDKVDFLLDLDELPLSMEMAIPCGLIVNELVSNALKHAFSNTTKKQKKIEIKIKAKEDDIVELSVWDNGKSLPKDFDIDKIKSLGLKLVATLAKNQLDGELKIDRRHGTKFIIRFKNILIGNSFKKQV
jgi:PAS domain S-box-containing protein